MYFYTKKLPLSGWNYDKLTKNNDNLFNNETLPQLDGNLDKPRRQEFPQL